MRAEHRRRQGCNNATLAPSPFQACAPFCPSIFRKGPSPCSPALRTMNHPPTPSHLSPQPSSAPRASSIGSPAHTQRPTQCSAQWISALRPTQCSAQWISALRPTQCSAQWISALRPTPRKQARHGACASAATLPHTSASRQGVCFRGMPNHVAHQCTPGKLPRRGRGWSQGSSTGCILRAGVAQPARAHLGRLVVVVLAAIRGSELLP